MSDIAVLRARQLGFTLIELLVVLVLLGLISSVAVVSVGSNNQTRELENEVRRIHALMQLSVEEAVLQNQEYGFYIDNEGYEFLLYDDTDNTWGAVQVDSLRPRDLPEWMSIELTRDDEAKELPTKDTQLDSEKAKKPLVLFLSSGESTIFTLTFFIGTEESQALTIKSEGYGDIELRTSEDKDDY